MEKSRIYPGLFILKVIASPSQRRGRGNPTKSLRVLAHYQWAGRSNLIEIPRAPHCMADSEWPFGSDCFGFLRELRNDRWEISLLAM